MISVRMWASVSSRQSPSARLRLSAAADSSDFEEDLEVVAGLRVLLALDALLTFRFDGESFFTGLDVGDFISFLFSTRVVERHRTLDLNCITISVRAGTGSAERSGIL